MRFTVGIPFASFDTGDEVTEADVLTKCPGADVPRLVRLGSLIPPAGAAATLVPVPVTDGEAELVADLQKRVEEAEADRDLHKEESARVAAERDALAKRVAELEAAAVAVSPAKVPATAVRSGRGAKPPESQPGPLMPETPTVTVPPAASTPPAPTS